MRIEPAPTLPSARQRARIARPPTAHRVVTFRSKPSAADIPDKPAGLALWWPMFVGIGLAFAAPRLWVQVQAAWSELGPRLVFPYLFLCARPELGLGHNLALRLTELMLYFQFPLEGMIVTWGIFRGSRLSKAFIQVLFLHGLGIFTLWLLSQ